MSVAVTVTFHVESVVEANQLANAVTVLGYKTQAGKIREAGEFSTSIDASTFTSCERCGNPLHEHTCLYPPWVD